MKCAEILESVMHGFQFGIELFDCLMPKLVVQMLYVLQDTEWLSHSCTRLHMP